MFPRTTFLACIAAVAGCSATPVGGGDPVNCYYDGDLDGYGYTTLVADPDGDCEDDAGQTATPGDCDDSRVDFHPGAADPPDDGFDQDCSGAGSRSCFVDGDNDGWGGDEVIVDPLGSCIGDGMAVDDGDCDDADPERHPEAAEVAGDGIDQDCDGVDLIDCYYDGDGDGYGFTTLVPDADGDCDDDPLQSSLGGDCDDSREAIHPGASDTVDDGVDQDCSGADSVTCFVDQDGDGWGTDTSFTNVDGDCGTEGGAGALDDGDCDDGDEEVHPLAAETPDDGVDQDCSGTDAASCFYDGDGDGYGWPGALLEADGDCEDDPNDAATGDDCNDAVAGVHPGATEIVGNGIDEDCSGTDSVACYADNDGDGWGDAIVTAPAGLCSGPGLAAVGGDCDDGAFGIHPGAAETPDDGVDQDCDAVDAADCFYDGDGDGYGWPGTLIELDGDCEDDAWDSATGDDCNDALAGVHPGATEIVGNGIDEDCSGADTVNCLADLDGDGWGSAAATSPSGTCSVAGLSALGGDCDDGAPSIHPTAVELPGDSIDQDCSGTDAVTCFYDGDGDGFGSTVTFIDPDGSCTDSVSDSANDDDCNDAISTIYPGAPEIIGDGIDQDCSGSAE